MAGRASEGRKADVGGAADRLRDQIDRGGTGDKVAFTDPAAAPLGTDDEAAGTPPTGDQVAQAARHETGRDQPGPKRTIADLQSGSFPRFFLATLCLAIAAGIAVWITFLS